MSKRIENLLAKLVKRVTFSIETKQVTVNISPSSLASAYVPLPTKKLVGISGVTLSGTGSANMYIWQTAIRDNDTAVSFTNTNTVARTITVYVQYIVVDE